jgi:uncharacterized Zn finger protein (UPF0148 family)
MSEPEIARRCPACGISVRDHAVFCPQCGGKIREAPAPSPASETPVPESVPEKAGVAENVRERVEKIRHVSSIVIDQAAYDPSLRFLLVAAGLFLVSLLLLILSKMIG